MVIIHTNEDITMRTATIDDAMALYKTVLRNKEYLDEWLPDVASLWSNARDVESSIMKWENGYDNRTQIVLLVLKGAEIIGRVGLHAMNMDLRNHSRMITYWLVENAQGQGIMTNCVRHLIDYAFIALQLNRLYVYCNENNTKSMAIPQRLGFVREGILQDGECLHNIYNNVVIYGCVKRNWQKN